MGTRCFLCYVHKRKQPRDSAFASSDDKSLPTCGLFVNKRICFYESKFFSLRVDPTETEDKQENGKNSSPKGIPIHFKIIPLLMRSFQYLLKESQVVNRKQMHKLIWTFDKHIYGVRCLFTPSWWDLENQVQLKRVSLEYWSIVIQR